MSTNRECDYEDTGVEYEVDVQIVNHGGGAGLERWVCPKCGHTHEREVGPE